MKKRVFIFLVFVGGLVHETLWAGNSCTKDPEEDERSGIFLQRKTYPFRQSKRPLYSSGRVPISYQVAVEVAFSR